MKNLLIATDLSPRSDRALKRALLLADRFKARLTVLHVLDEEMPSSALDQLRKAAEQTIADRLDEFPAADGANISVKSVAGTAFMDIIREAEDGDADLIVLGTHRSDLLGDFFRGTTVERVIRYGSTPVLVVRNPAKDPYRRVLVGVDFSVCSRRAVEFAVGFVPDGEFSLAHAFDVPFGGLISGAAAREDLLRKRQDQMDAMLNEEMKGFFSSLATPPANLEPIMAQGTVREVLLEQVGALRPDLLVLGTHGRTGVAHGVLGSVAEDLLSDPPCDVLAVKAW